MGSLASDNYAPTHPLILQALQQVNAGHCPSYGGDPWTARAEQLFREIFGPKCEVLFVLTGTAANVLGLQTLIAPYQALICPASAHIQVDECGAPERHLGCKLLDVPCPDGKLTPQGVEDQLQGLGFVHHVQPAVVAIAQSSEYGTVYSLRELEELREVCQRRGLKLFLDGARLFNAAAHLNAPLGEIARCCDVLTVGGTKNGLMMGEAVVFPNGAPPSAAYYRKQLMQLTSKMRYVAAQFSALFQDELWKANAQAANAMALKLAQGLRERGVEPTQAVESNAVFCHLQGYQNLQRVTQFYAWEPSRSEVRLMTSYDTTLADLEEFFDHLDRAVACGEVVVARHCPQKASVL